MLETIFYTLGIIAISVFLVVVIAAFLIFIKIRMEILAFKRGFVAQTINMISERKTAVASTVGLSVARFLFDRFKNRRSK